MSDETSNRFAGAPDRPGHSGGSSGDGSPLQARAAFVKNWDWQSVVLINRGACERGGAQHGLNSETAGACAAEWEGQRVRVATLGETFDFLKRCHRLAPFLFFNGNTFAAIGRELGRALFSDLPPARNREVTSAVAHYIAGVLDREAMVQIVESLCESAELQVGDRVKTLRGSVRGVIKRVLEDGRVVWQADGASTELTALPETLMKENET
ncbi:MAG: hypothetical protein WCS70_05970 [Verrucomicrobiota bacterium]